jgi:hypothetical protein
VPSMLQEIIRHRWRGPGFRRSQRDGRSSAK